MSIKREVLKIINSEHEKVKTENLWVEIVKSTGEKFVVSVIYRHSDGNVTNFSKKLEHSLDTLNHDRTITHKIITGDFNIDLIKFITIQQLKSIWKCFYNQFMSGNLLTDMSDHFAKFCIIFKQKE